MWFLPDWAQPQKTSLFNSRVASERLACIFIAMGRCKMWFYPESE
jgi:hypothetical protein